MFDFEVFDGDNSPVQLKADVSERERRRYIETFRAVANAAQTAAAGFEDGEDTKALAGSIATGMIFGQISGEIHEVIEDALRNASQRFAPFDPDTVEIPDTVEELFAEADNDNKENN